MASHQDREIDRLVELIADRVRDRLGRGALPALAPRDRGPCVDDESEDCAGCGGCVVRRPWSVRAVEDAGATRVGAAPGVGRVEADLGRMIDHTLLKPDATRDEVVKLCDEARQHHFASVCVNTTWVPLCRSLLGGSDVKVCSVVGFPLGAMAPTAKAYEARDAVRQGAQEIDMVINLGALKSRDYETVFEDICRVVKASAPALVKVILETGQLTGDEKVIACTLSKLAGAHFVKTSTGFGKGGATVEDVALMRRVVGSEMGVKASGGVRTQEDALRMRQAGATRIGASASVAIVTGPSGTERDRPPGKGAGASRGKPGPSAY
jgi:deoxyribose-phosphate aldolase